MSRLLVCPPDYFSIDYEINPWMRRSNVVAPERAIQQWHRLMEVLERDIGTVLERMKPVAGLPDLVFTANAGVVVGRKAVPSRFRYPERQREEAHYDMKSSHWTGMCFSKGPATCWGSTPAGSAATGSVRTFAHFLFLANCSVKRSFLWN
jgi:hypothetical protein